MAGVHDEEVQRNNVKKESMKALATLPPGIRFTWKDRVFLVCQHEGNMTEVFDGDRYWSWNCQAKVEPIWKYPSMFPENHKQSQSL